ncbi:hypothetical protein OCC_13670 [Thermococcus litoralis DSM 5473]|uniref:Uncharacterized protein n=1 Tax=Thermococcus litoralis (strain ATCC 51850 / DSM 5473 / JCM 8560 / NS-C) TaxID=523849 RepID=S5ZTM7_THELN|nr:hypothetical protein [Thermococcus litoralis]AGT34224.1 hypothetical protein OCC_13670 [Thermococcus litoralis DSM 5473]
MPLELLKRHYGDNLLAVAQVRDTLLVILREGTRSNCWPMQLKAFSNPLLRRVTM